VDADFGPFFLKFGTYFPYTAKLCINGNEWAKRQAAKAGIGFTPLDNGFAAIDDPADVAILQAEFSLTQMLDRPVSGRIFFEQVLRDNLDIGRPDQVSLVFNRRIIGKGRYATPGRFRTRVITDGVIPSLHIDYKNTKVKQYHNCDARSHAMSEYVGLEVQPMLKT
jgi:hypothetical protein